MNDFNDLGLMKDYGNLIISVILLIYWLLYTYLENKNSKT